MQWFRFYGETPSDRKLHRVARATAMSRMTVLGCWTTLLCLASESNAGGKLLIGDGIPATIDDVSETFQFVSDDTQRLIDAFIDNGLVKLEGVTLCVANWNKRQFRSDVSTERVHKHRKQRALPQRSRNVSETPPDTDTDTDTEVPTTTPLVRNIDRCSLGKNGESLSADLKEIYSEALALYDKKLDARETKRCAAWVREYGETEVSSVLTSIVTSDQTPNYLTAYVNSVLHKRREGAEPSEPGSKWKAIGYKPVRVPGLKLTVWADESEARFLNDFAILDQIRDYATKYPDRCFPLEVGS